MPVGDADDVGSGEILMLYKHFLIRLRGSLLSGWLTIDEVVQISYLQSV
jgi:hypothetical protein